jgi:hypothetical protein
MQTNKPTSAPSAPSGGESNVKTQITNATTHSYIHICGDEAKDDFVHPRKRKSNREDIKRKMQLAADNQSTLKLHIEKTKHLKVLHTFAQIKEE